MGSAIEKMLVEQIATAGELKNCPDMIPIRYNGLPGERMDPDHIRAKGNDYRWFGKRRITQGGSEGWETYPGHPVRILEDGRAVVPNCPENVEILESFKPQRRLRRVETAAGHKYEEFGAPHPPLYERLKADGAIVSLADLSEKDQEALAERIYAKMQRDKVAPPVEQVEATVIDPNAEAKIRAQQKLASLREDLVAANSLLGDPNMGEEQRAELEAQVKATEKNIKATETELKKLG